MERNSHFKRNQGNGFPGRCLKKDTVLCAIYRPSKMEALSCVLYLELCDQDESARYFDEVMGMKIVLQ